MRARLPRVTGVPPPRSPVAVGDRCGSGLSGAVIGRRPYRGPGSGGGVLVTTGRRRTRRVTLTIWVHSALQLMITTAPPPASASAAPVHGGRSRWWRDPSPSAVSRHGASMPDSVYAVCGRRFENVSEIVSSGSPASGSMHSRSCSPSGERASVTSASFQPDRVDARSGRRHVAAPVEVRCAERVRPAQHHVPADRRHAGVERPVGPALAGGALAGGRVDRGVGQLVLADESGATDDAVPRPQRAAAGRGAARAAPGSSRSSRPSTTDRGEGADLRLGLAALERLGPLGVRRGGCRRSGWCRRRSSGRRGPRRCPTTARRGWSGCGRTSRRASSTPRRASAPSAA